MNLSCSASKAGHIFYNRNISNLNYFVLNTYLVGRFSGVGTEMIVLNHLKPSSIIIFIILSMISKCLAEREGEIDV